MGRVGFAGRWRGRVRIASCLVVEENCKLERLKRIVVKVFLLPGSAYVSPRRPAYCTGPRPHDLDQTSCLVLLLLISRLFGLRQTRLPHVWLWTELHSFCRVPHHGASLPPKRSGTKNCDLNSLPGCKSPLPFIGFILSECVSECVGTCPLDKPV